MSYPVLSTSRQYINSMGYPQSKLDPRTDDEKAKDCQKYLQVLAEQRLWWEPMIDNIIAYVNHGRRFVQYRDQWPGQQTGQEVFDDTAMLARKILVDGMVGYLCSRNQPWFGLELPGKFNFPRTSGMRSWSGLRVDSYPQVRKWLEDSQEVLYAAFNRSNFYDVIPQFISDGATVGTGYCLIEEDIANSAIAFTVPHFRECFIAENQFGKVDTTYRVYRMTLRQMVQKFGLEEMIRVNENFKRDYASNMYTENEVLHAVYPRSDFDPWRADAKGKRWESRWVYRHRGKLIDVSGAVGSGPVDDVKTLSEGGYDSMPMLAWRWDKNSDEVYGRGPGHNAFVSVALANQMGRTNLITAHKAAEPPLVAFSDMRGVLQRGPGGVTYLERDRTRGGMKENMPLPLLTGVQQLPFNVEYQDRVAQRIKEFFFNDVFMMMLGLSQQGNQSRMTDEHVRELQGEKAAILGTRVGNLQSEAFDPLISRVFDIEARAGRIPQPPDILLESVHGPVAIEYLGPLAQAQTRLTKVRNITTGIELATQVAKINPTAIDTIDADMAVKEIFDAVSFPVSCIRNPKQVAAIRDQRNKLAQQERTAENVPKLARAAASLAKAPEAGSILQQLTGGGEAAQ